MYRAGKIIAWLWVMTYGYAWTVGQSGLATVDRNLCELWDAVFWQTLECHPHNFLLPAWGIGAFIAVVFLVTDFVHARKKAKRPKLETFLWVILVVGLGVSIASAIGLWRMHNIQTAAVAPITSTPAPSPSPASQLNQPEGQPTIDIAESARPTVKGNTIIGEPKGVFRARNTTDLLMENNFIIDRSLPAPPLPPPTGEFSSLSNADLKNKSWPHPQTCGRCSKHRIFKPGQKRLTKPIYGFPLLSQAK